MAEGVEGGKGGEVRAGVCEVRARGVGRAIQCMQRKLDGSELGRGIDLNWYKPARRCKEAIIKRGKVHETFFGPIKRLIVQKTH